jgi:hypothetical protein
MVLGRQVRTPILFLPQLIGLAFGLPESDLMLKREVVRATAVPPSAATAPARPSLRGELWQLLLQTTRSGWQ